MLYSDRIRAVFPGYILDKSNRIIASSLTPTLNFERMIELYLTKDLSRDKEFDWVALQKDRFLDKSIDMKSHGVAFCSYVRAGSSMLRKYLE